MSTRFLFTLPVAILMMLAIGADRPAAQMRGMGAMNGTVTDESGSPIEGAEVRTVVVGGARLECKSNAEGVWNLRGLGRGAWEIVIVKPGFASRAIRVVLNQELARTEDIKVVLKKV